MMFLSWVVQCLLILLSVAFFTLFERNVIGLFHTRVGPNNVSFLGLLQPLLDAFNLLSNQSITPINSNKFTYGISPLISLLFGLFIWLTMPSVYVFMSLNFSILMFFCIGSVIVFCVLLSGWASNSNYSLIGSLRSVAQSISYEAVFSTLIVLICLFLFSYSIRSYMVFSSYLLALLLPIWIICVLAETHRAPFDFSEAESELVSGFNTEYSGVNFAFIFLSEYAVLLFSSILIVILFVMPFSFSLSEFFLILATLLVSFFFIWIRITFCRFRYDMLIIFSWNVLLPVSMMIFVLFVFML